MLRKGLGTCEPHPIGCGSSGVRIDPTLGICDTCYEQNTKYLLHQAFLAQHAGCTLQWCQRAKYHYDDHLDDDVITTVNENPRCPMYRRPPVNVIDHEDHRVRKTSTTGIQAFLGRYKVGQRSHEGDQ